MRTGESITEKIRAASDIVEVVGQFVTLKQAGQAFRGLCPFHREKTPSFHVRPVEQYFKCFGCGKAGDVFTFLMELNSASFLEARQMLADQAGIAVEDIRGESGSGVSRQDLLRANSWAMNLFRRELMARGGQDARNYVASRGIADSMSEQFQMGLAPNASDFLLRSAKKKGISEKLLLAAGLIREGQNGSRYDSFRNRLMFPIVDAADRVLGFGGRTLGDDSAKYINSPETAVFHKSRCLYGVNHARRTFAQRGRAVLVEGYTDVILAHQNGFTETVAPLGTALTEQQSDVLRRYVPSVVVVFDADSAGQRAADRGAEIALKSHLDVFLAVMQDGLDPCDFLRKKPASDFDALLISAAPALPFKWERTLREHQGGGSPAAKLRAVRSFVDFVASSDVFGRLDEMQRGLVIDELVRLLGISRKGVCEQIDDARRRRGGPRNEDGTSGSAREPEPQAQRARPTNAREAAALEILIALVCEPMLYAQVADLFDPRSFVDPQLHRIADWTVKLAREKPAFGPSDLIEKLESPTDAARVVDLLEEGRSAGQLSDRLSASADRLRTVVASAQLSRKAQEEWFASQAPQADEPEGDGDHNLAELSNRTHEYASASNFAGIRKFKADAVEH